MEYCRADISNFPVATKPAIPTFYPLTESLPNSVLETEVNWYKY